jgi:hypothetical protein
MRELVALTHERRWTPEERAEVKAIEQKVMWGLVVLRNSRGDTVH